MHSHIDRDRLITPPANARHRSHSPLVIFLLTKHPKMAYYTTSCVQSSRAMQAGYWRRSASPRKPTVAFEEGEIAWLPTNIPSNSCLWASPSFFRDGRQASEALGHPALVVEVDQKAGKVICLQITSFGASQHLTDKWHLDSKKARERARLYWLVEEAGGDYRRDREINDKLGTQSLQLRTGHLKRKSFLNLEQTFKVEVHNLQRLNNGQCKLSEKSCYRINVERYKEGLDGGKPTIPGCEWPGSKRSAPPPPSISSGLPTPPPSPTRRYVPPHKKGATDMRIDESSNSHHPPTPPLSAFPPPTSYFPFG
jgi:hypothetical protein